MTDVEISDAVKELAIKLYRSAVGFYCLESYRDEWEEIVQEALDATRAEARREAFEEAAKVFYAEPNFYTPRLVVASRIRALATQPAPEIAPASDPVSRPCLNQQDAPANASRDAQDGGSHSAPEGSEPMRSADCGRAAFDKHIHLTGHSHPRLGIRMATWEELSDRMRDEWRQVAQAAIRANSTVPRTLVGAAISDDLVAKDSNREEVITTASPSGEATPRVEPPDRSLVSCVISTWTGMLDNFEKYSIQHTLITDTIGMLRQTNAASDPMRSAEELHLCPFCGYGASLIYDGEAFYHAVCSACGAITGDAYMEDVAADMWNRRAI